MAAEKIARMRLPWMTVTFVLLAVGIYYSPDLSQRLIFDRPLILVGEWWRVPASSLVHYSTMHLFWNLLALFVLEFPALLRFLAEALPAFPARGLLLLMLRK